MLLCASIPSSKSGITYTWSVFNFRTFCSCHYANHSEADFWNKHDFHVIEVGIKGAPEQSSTRRYSTGALSVTKSANSSVTAKANASLRAGKFFISTRHDKTCSGFICIVEAEVTIFMGTSTFVLVWFAFAWHEITIYWSHIIEFVLAGVQRKLEMDNQVACSSFCILFLAVCFLIIFLLWLGVWEKWKIPEDQYERISI